MVLARSTAADGGGGGGGGDVRQWLMKLQQSKDSRNAIKRLEEEARSQLLALGLLLVRGMGKDVGERGYQRRHGSSPAAPATFSVQHRKH